MQPNQSNCPVIRNFREEAPNGRKALSFRQKKTRWHVSALTGGSRVLAAVFGGNWHIWRLEQDLRRVKINGTWRIILSEDGTY